MVKDSEEGLRYRLIKMTEVLDYISKGYQYCMRPDDFKNAESTVVKYGEFNAKKS